jgi:CRP-like cAMP-binding protein
MRKFIESALRLSDTETIDQLIQSARIISLKKETILVSAGEVQTHVTFLKEGVLRGYVLDANGKEITDCFINELGAPAIGCNCFGKASFISIEAMTDCTLIQIPVSKVMEILDQYPELFRVYNRFLLDALQRHWEIKMALYQYTAMQRYQWFLQSYPGLIDAVTNKHIASFLGITPVTLSRLRKQMKLDDAQKAAML